VNATTLRDLGSKLTITGHRVTEAIQSNGGSIERAAHIAEYFAAVEHEHPDRVEKFEEDAKLLRSGDPDTLKRWGLWFTTIADNADHDD